LLFGCDVKFTQHDPNTHLQRQGITCQNQQAHESHHGRDRLRLRVAGLLPGHELSGCGRLRGFLLLGHLLGNAQQAVGLLHQRLEPRVPLLLELPLRHELRATRLARRRVGQLPGRVAVLGRNNCRLARRVALAEELLLPRATDAIELELDVNFPVPAIW
jgi:hypothetical protein